eukprot:gene11005-16922_t
MAGKPGDIGFGIRENLSLGRRWDHDPSGGGRPKFDLMGKLQAWAEENACARDPNSYFYTTYLVDMEGYPQEVRFAVSPTQQEHLHLRLLSLAEERKFWKSFYFYVEQYEFEDNTNVQAMIPGRTDCIEHALRMSDIGSPAVFKSFRDYGIDDHMLAGLSLECTYDQCKFPDDILNVLDGNSVYEMLKQHQFTAATPKQVHAFLLNLLKLKMIPVQVRDEVGSVVAQQVFTYEQIPTLNSIPENFGLEGGTDKWFIDIRNFFSTPGHMIFDEYNYQNFLLDWYLTGANKWNLACDKGIVITKKRSPEQLKE